MSLHILSVGDELKSSVVSTTPAIGGVVVLDDEIALWLDPAIDTLTNQLSVHSFVNDCLERLREVGTPTPTVPTTFTYAFAAWTNSIAPQKKDITVSLNAAFTVPGADEIRLYVGELFQPLFGSSVSTAVKRLLESWSEIHGRKAA